MLSSLGFIGSGSRVIVPNIVGLLPTNAQTAFSYVGLSVGTVGSTSSGATSQNNGSIASQDIAAGTDVERGTAVGYVVYSYTAPPPVSYPPVWTDNTIAGLGLEGVPFTDSVSATNMQYSGTYSITAGALPSGISLNSSTGAITGTPTTASPYSFTITAQNSYGSTSASFNGFISSPAVISLGVYFDTPSSTSSLTGTIFAENTSGSAVTISLSTSAGSISPASFLVNSEATVTPTFIVTGLSASQTVTVVASGSGATASNSATTIADPGGGGGSTPPTYTYYFEYDLGTPTVPPGGELMTSGSVVRSTSGNVTVNTGSGCGSQTFYAFAPGTWYWICYRVQD